MKKYIKFTFVLMALMILSITSLFAQTVEAVESGFDISSPFITFTALVAIIPTVTEFFKSLLGKTSDTNNQLVQVLSWIIGIGITMGGWFFNLGFLSGLEWYIALLYGFGASLAANGIADTKIIQSIISLFGKK